MSDNVKSIRAGVSVQTDIERELLDHIRSKFETMRAHDATVTGIAFVVFGSEGKINHDICGWLFDTFDQPEMAAVYAGERLKQVALSSGDYIDD